VPEERVDGGGMWRGADGGGLGRAGGRQVGGFESGGGKINDLGADLLDALAGEPV